MKRKKRLALLVVCLSLTVCFAACTFVYLWLGSLLESQKAAERWRGESETRFAQVSAFFPVGEEIQLNTVRTFRTAMDAALLEASLEAPEGGALWVDGYSAQQEVTVSSEKGSATVTAIGVGGDFFHFHPLRLRSGSYISGEDLMQDRVVLDEELAWQLFGGVDLAGLSVTIAGEPYLIAGVVERETDFATAKAYTGNGGLYVSYETLVKLAGAEPGISCYEVVMADPIQGFALSEAQEQFPTAAVVENSSRYSLRSIFSVIGDFGQRSMNTLGVIYPYWENAARLTEDYMALCVVLAILFGLLPAVVVLVVAIELLRRGWKKLKTSVVSAKDRWSERRYEKARLRQAEEKSYIDML